MSVYISDPALWKKFYENMSDKYFNPYSYRAKRKHAVSNHSFLIPVNRNATERNVVQQITPSAAILERAKGNLERERKDEEPHIDPRMNRKRKRSSGAPKNKKPRMTSIDASSSVSRKQTGERKRSSDSRKGKKRRMKSAGSSIRVSRKAVAGRKRKKFDDIWSTG